MTAPRIIVLLGVAIIGLLVYLFSSEAGAIFWHLRHGAAAELDGLSFHVPALYSASVNPGQKVLYLVAVPGRARNYFKGDRTSKVSMISLYQSPAGEMRQFPGERVDPWASHAFVKSRDRALNVAGNTGRCVEFTGPPIWNGDKDVEIMCEFQKGFEAHFSGTTVGVDDFYRILQTAQRDKERN